MNSITDLTFWNISVLYSNGSFKLSSLSRPVERETRLQGGQAVCSWANGTVLAACLSTKKCCNLHCRVSLWLIRNELYDCCVDRGLSCMSIMVLFYVMNTQNQLQFSIFTGRNEVLAKVIFLHQSVIHSVHGGGGTWPDQTRPPPWDQAGTPLDQAHPQLPDQAGTPLCDQAGTPPPPLESADSGIRSTIGQYASYWNAFLLGLFALIGVRALFLALRVQHMHCNCCKYMM